MPAHSRTLALNLLRRKLEREGFDRRRDEPFETCGLVGQGPEPCMRMLPGCVRSRTLRARFPIELNK